MDFNFNKNLRIDTASEQQDDFSWNEVSDMKMKQSLLTDIGVSSEKNQYRDTIEGILADEEPTEERVDPFKRFTDRPLDKESVEYFDKLINDGKVTFDENGKQITGRLDDNLPVWNKLKNKGYTPDSLNKAVTDRTNQQWVEYQRKLNTYDEESNPIASISANLWGGLKSMAHDPIQWLSFAAQAEGVKVGKVKQAARMSKKAIIESTPMLAKYAKRIDEMMGHNPTGAAELRKQMNKFVSIATKNAAKAKSKYGSEAVAEVSILQRELESKGLDAPAVIAMMVKKAKDKKNPISEKSAQLILDMTKGDNLKNAATQGGITGAVMGFGEWLVQESSYDFKHSVLPEYTKKDKYEAVGMSMGFGFVGGAVFEALTPLVLRWKNRDLSGWTLHKDIDGEEQILKYNKQMADDTLDTVPNPTDDEVIAQMKSGKSTDEHIENNIKQSEENVDFKEVTDKYNKQQQELDLIQKCINGGM